MRRAAVIVAGGKGSRFGEGKKEFATIDGVPALRRAVAPFLAGDRFETVAIVIAPEYAERAAAMLSSDLGILDPRIRFVESGPERADSVRRGLDSLEQNPPDIVLIHDGARPWLSEALLTRVVEGTELHGACIPTIPVTDTIKAIDDRGRVVAHPRRSGLGAAQTPQGFRFQDLLRAHRELADRAGSFTDDAELAAAVGVEVYAVDGERENRKITYKDDLSIAELPMRVGQGWDIHALVPGRRLPVAGVHVDHDLGEDGWSDGDALAHAVTDAILGACALGDIGTHFPPSDPSWKGADSMRLLTIAVAKALETGWRPASLDCIVALERPKLAPYADSIRASLAGALSLPLDRVSFKAKTYEGFGAVGEGRAIEASALVTVTRA
jgi:2-C-methyl-D-erythritol 4-phosphate cytidylyltransferase/2-C-methyl-D-erythritol 2,4-cyclodiphosphate synthase